MLALGEPALLALVGQTQLRGPEQILSEALAGIRQVEDEVERGRLLTALASLMGSEEALAMVEQMLDVSEELLLDTPYLRRIRQQGKEEGLAEGVAKGKEEGVLAGLREVILETIALRFNPPAQEYRQVSRQLEDIAHKETLHRLFVTAIQAEDMATFASHLAEELPDQ